MQDARTGLRKQGSGRPRRGWRSWGRGNVGRKRGEQKRCDAAVSRAGHRQPKLHRARCRGPVKRSRCAGWMRGALRRFVRRCACQRGAAPQLVCLCCSGVVWATHTGAGRGGRAGMMAAVPWKGRLRAAAPSPLRFPARQALSASDAESPVEPAQKSSPNPALM